MEEGRRQDRRNVRRTLEGEISKGGYSTKSRNQVVFARCCLWARSPGAKETSAWWTTDTQGESKVGDVLKFRFGGDRGFDMEVLELDPAKRVLWQVVEGPAEWVGTKVSFDHLRQEGDWALIFFKHLGWKEPVEFMHHCSTKMGCVPAEPKIASGIGKRPSVAKRDQTRQLGITQPEVARDRCNSSFRSVTAVSQSASPLQAVFVAFGGSEPPTCRAWGSMAAFSRISTSQSY